MSDDIALTSGVRQNLLSLRKISDLLSDTQTHLATGRKLLSPLDGPVQFFTSEGLQNRANDLSALLDAMSNAIQTVKAAGAGIEAIVTAIQSMQSALFQARQDASWQSKSFTLNVTVAGRTLDFSGGAVTGTVSIALDDGGGNFYTVNQLVDAINASAGLIGKVKASNDAGQLRIENFSTADLDVAGMATAGGSVIDGTAANVTTIGGNIVRQGIAVQFNQLVEQLDKLSADASFNGINLLQGDVLKVIFNEQSTSILEIVARDLAGNPLVIDAASLGISALQNSDLDSNASIDLLIDDMAQALQMARTQISGFSSDLAIVQNRQSFTKQMIAALQTGADNLVVADTNEEGANMLALQTRQQLSITALSLASQASQSVLRLFG